MHRVLKTWLPCELDSLNVVNIAASKLSTLDFLYSALSDHPNLQRREQLAVQLQIVGKASII